MDKHARQMGRRILALYKEQEPALRELITRGTPPSCTKGCSHCCNLQVYITMPEALAIAEYVSQSPTLLKRTVQSCQESISKQKLSSTDHFRENIPCAFLSDKKECSVYEVRPMPCRHHFAITPPENCSSENTTAEVGRYDTTALDVEVLKTSLRETTRNNIPPLVAPIPVAVMWALRLLEDGPVKFLTVLETQENLGLADIRMWTQIALMRDESEQTAGHAEPVSEPVSGSV